LTAPYLDRGLAVWLVASDSDTPSIAGAWEAADGVVATWDQGGAAYAAYADLIALSGAAPPYPLTVVIDTNGVIALAQTSRDPAALDALLGQLLDAGPG
jgi:hypothetical protein